jgi:uncharacterized protein (TIGR02996 family)
VREAFERALQENPDDIAGWCAFADWLQEQGDPRGEFMAVQIALEDEGRRDGERRALKRREKELLAAHERDWLGELAPFVLDAAPLYADLRRIDAEFTRGWLTGLVCRALSVNEARALARTPEARMLTRLLISKPAYENAGETPEGYNDSYYQPGPDVPADIDEFDAPSLHALTHVPHLTNLRVFGYGDGPTAPDDTGEEYGQCHANGPIVHQLVARMRRLEELYLYAHAVDTEALFALSLPRLHVLHIDHLSSYPLPVLAANRSLGQLTHLSCHPHAQEPDDTEAYIRLDDLRAVCRSPHLRNLSHLRLRLTDFGDEGADEVIASGLLKRLRVLDLSYGCMTDAGAAALAACPDLRNLALLDLSRNALGENGIAALRATGVTMKVDDQHGEHPSRMGDDGYLEYLGYGDME